MLSLPLLAVKRIQAQECMNRGVMHHMTTIFHAALVVWYSAEARSITCIYMQMTSRKPEQEREEILINESFVLTLPSLSLGYSAEEGPKMACYLLRWMQNQGLESYEDNFLSRTEMLLVCGAQAVWFIFPYGSRQWQTAQVPY